MMTRTGSSALRPLSRRTLCLGAGCLGLHGHSAAAQPASRGADWTCLSVDPPPTPGLSVTGLSALAERDAEAVARLSVENRVTPFGVASLAHAWRRSDGRARNTGDIVLGVHFINGNDAQRAKVRQVFPLWLNSAQSPPRIFFRWDQSLENSDIRILWGAEGNKSYIGRAANNFPGAPTMWLQNWDRDDILLHECGHALGLQHEHLHPGVRIEWNVDQVVAHFSPWPANYTRRQVMQRLDESFTCGPFDPGSVMIYPLPSGLARIKDGASGEMRDFTAQPGLTPSLGDFRCLSFLYRTL